MFVSSTLSNPDNIGKCIWQCAKRPCRSVAIYDATKQQCTSWKASFDDVTTSDKSGSTVIQVTEREKIGKSDDSAFVELCNGDAEATVFHSDRQEVCYIIELTGPSVGERQSM